MTLGKPTTSVRNCDTFSGGFPFKYVGLFYLTIFELYRHNLFRIVSPICQMRSSVQFRTHFRGCDVMGKKSTL